MKDEKSVRFRQEQVSAFSGNNCPLSAGFSVRNRRNMHNALKFTGRGGVIEVLSSKTNSFYEISIRDTGVGIQPEDVDKLFKLETNYTTKGTEEEGGTGLGLILVKEFVEKNKGVIRVESKPGSGSNFIFTLPAAKSA